MHANTLSERSYAILIVLLFIGVAVSPCINAHTVENRRSTDYFSRQTEKKIVEITCRIFSSERINEIKKNISIEDLKVLNDLYGNNIQTFVEKLCRLGLLGNQTVEKTMKLINEKSQNEVVTFSDNTTNKNCLFKFTGDIFKIYYLPIPYIALQFFLKYGDLIIAPFALLFIFLLLLASTHPVLLQTLQNLLNKIGTVIDKVLTVFGPAIERMITFTYNLASLLGWIHCWAPLKFPFRNTIITSGNLHLVTLGAQGNWERTATMSLTIMGFQGLWISLPPLSLPPYTPTWCIGHAKLVISN
jgi:hypothetical protein